MKFLKSMAFASLLLVVGVSTGSDMFLAHAAEKNGIVVEDAWSRERPAGAIVGGAFVTIHNKEGEQDQLVAASSPIADKVEIHTTVMQGGVMSMLRQEELIIPAGETIVMKPGGFHVMLMGLKENLEKGKKFPLTLNFARAGEITVEVHVKEAGAMNMDMKMNKE
ncbi:MAG: copper chaperone PCu(A)C [Sneathiella sp.]|nr:copper chaperone PCu(A)C [Sneathiella sp.]